MELLILLQAKNFGITNLDALYQAGLKAADAIQHVCFPVVGIALLIRIFSFLTKIFTEREADFFGLGKSLLLLLFLFNYGEIMGQLNNLISYFTDSVQSLFGLYGSGHTLVDKMDQVYDAYDKAHPHGIFDWNKTPFTDWILANLSHMIIIIAKTITETIRSLVMLFLYATGPIAILVSVFPGFEDNIKTFLRYYISVGFWSVTLGVVDLLLYYYLDWCQKNGSIDGVTSMNIGLTLMYLMAPYLTSRYIGGIGSQFMSRMIQNATTAVTMGKMSVLSKMMSSGRGGSGTGTSGGGPGGLVSSGLKYAGVPSGEKTAAAATVGSGLWNSSRSVKFNYIPKNKGE